MLILLSPAKTLDLTPTERDLPATKPELHADAKRLAKLAKELSPKQLAKLMKISDGLAETAHGYFQSWKQTWNPRSAKQAVLTFRGDVYQGLDADSLSDTDLQYAQEHLRTLSGLYGVLRPLDLIQGYRLEMGRALKNPRGRDLYAYWQEAVTDAIDRTAHAADGKPLIVNLASAEYAKVVRFGELNTEVVTPVFKDRSKGEFKTIGLFAKRARGLMARFLLQSQAKDEANLRRFRVEGYRYNAALSKPGAPAFSRERPYKPGESA